MKKGSSISCNRLSEKQSQKESGASMVEYALLIAVIAGIVIIALRGLGVEMSSFIRNAAVTGFGEGE
jgi:Flp pilus assembly pilin Flp